MPTSTLTLSCPDGFKYQPGNKVLATFGDNGVNIGEVITALWNVWWDNEDQYDPSHPDEPGLHYFCRVQFDGEYMIVNASESYCLEDFAASLEDLFKFPIIVNEGKVT